MPERAINRHTLALATYLLGMVALSALTDPWHLALVGLATVAVFRRDVVRALRKALLLAGPYVAIAVLAFLARERVVSGHWGGGEVALGLTLRCLLMATLSFIFTTRVSLVRALAFSWTLSTLLTLALSQVYLFRRLTTDFAQALESRSARRPGTLGTIRAASTLSGSCLKLSLQHASDVADALRSRGLG